MVFNVRCYKCGEHEVRLVLGGRAIIHARCHGCDSNLLAEIMDFEQQIMDEQSPVNENSGQSKPLDADPPAAATDTRGNDDAGLQPGSPT